MSEGWPEPEGGAAALEEEAAAVQRHPRPDLHVRIPPFDRCRVKNLAIPARSPSLLVQARHTPVDLSAGSRVIVSRGITVVGPLLVTTKT
jgi:hypothetical protein